MVRKVDSSDFAGFTLGCVLRLCRCGRNHRQMSGHSRGDRMLAADHLVGGNQNKSGRDCRRQFSPLAGRVIFMQCSNAG